MVDDGLDQNSNILSNSLTNSEISFVRVMVMHRGCRGGALQGAKTRRITRKRTC